ncbi:hypothetical protein PIROE2DRAFT_15976, partial [Piromyces sp. E2]
MNRYTYNKQFDMTLSYYLQIYRPNALDLIKKYNLYSMLEPLIVLMMKYDEHFVESRLIKKQQKASLKNKSKRIASVGNSNMTSRTNSYNTSNVTSAINSDNEEEEKKSVEETFTFTPIQKIREAVKGDAVKIFVENTDRIL